MMFLKKFLRGLNTLLTTVLVVVLLLTVFVVIYSKASGDEPSFFNYQMKTVLSGSMEPDIQTGSVIFIEIDIDTGRLGEGDIVTYRVDDHVLVTHRIVEVLDGGEAFVTKGDANQGSDVEPVLAENIVGEYTGKTIPYLGYAVNFVNSKQGALFVLIFPGFLCIGYSFVMIWQILRHVERSKKDIEAKVD